MILLKTEVNVEESCCKNENDCSLQLVSSFKATKNEAFSKEKSLSIETNTSSVKFMRKNTFQK